MIKLKQYAAANNISYRTALKYFHEGRIDGATQLNNGTIMIDTSKAGIRSDSLLSNSTIPGTTYSSNVYYTGNNYTGSLLNARVTDWNNVSTNTVSATYSGVYYPPYIQINTYLSSEMIDANFEFIKNDLEKKGYKIVKDESIINKCKCASKKFNKEK